MERTVARDTFVRMQSMSLQWHLNRPTGAVLRSVSRGASSFATVLRVLLFQLLPVMIQTVVVAVYLSTQFEWAFAAIAVALIVGYVAFTLVCTEWRNKFRRRMNQADNEYNQKGVDALLNFETVKYFNAEEHETERYDSALRRYQDANARSLQSLGILNFGQNFVIRVAMLGALLLAAYRVTNEDDITVGDFVMIQGFLLQLTLPLNFLGTYWRMLKQALVDVESMQQLLEAEPDIGDAEDASTLVMDESNSTIEFENVRFSYRRLGQNEHDEEDPEPAILKGVSFSVSPGEHVAVVGSTGAGKSTILRLLYRFYDVTDGTVRVGGQDVRTVTQHSLRRHIGIVPQDCVLFNDTIGYNIAYGTVGLGSEASEDEVQQAVHMARLQDAIERMPQGLETKVGERGLRLSGGEKQRVAIARALLKKPRILVFDEATSSLDNETERQIQEELDFAAQGRTSLTIAHRLTTIQNCDRILVLKDGLIVERGSHDELLSLDGEYARMWQQQARVEQLEHDLLDAKCDAVGNQLRD
ncbi:MAG: hypothetical protein MHM6MM_007612 [Cercozoa sp. M6MM]